jgi:hypothetical protein
VLALLAAAADVFWAVQLLDEGPQGRLGRRGDPSDYPASYASVLWVQWFVV